MTPAPQRPAMARLWHWLFEMSLVIKGTLTLGEFVAGLGLLVMPNALILRLLGWLTHYEIAEDPTDRMAQAAQRLVSALSIETQHFYALYLTAHGGLKFAMVIALAYEALWAFPLAMAVLSGFVAYQLHGYIVDGSTPLLVLALFDSFMIYLVWKEYRARRALNGVPA